MGAYTAQAQGSVGPDGIEHVSTNDVFDSLEAPMRRRPSETVHLSRLYASPRLDKRTRPRPEPGSYRDRVRGYAREVPEHPATLRQQNEI